MEEKDKQVTDSRFDRVTPSGLSSLEGCPRKYAIQRDYAAARKVHKDLPEDPPTYKMVFGSIFHRVVELGKRTAEDIAKVAKDVLRKEGSLEFDDRYKGVDDLAKGVETCMGAFVVSPEAEPWTRKRKGAKFEEKFETIIDGMPMLGIVDCITDKGEVLDLKTTSKSFGGRMWHGSQLTAYHMLAKENTEGIQDDAQVVKVYRPVKPDGATGVEGQWLPAAKNVPHVKRLVKMAKTIRDRQDEWQKDYTKIVYNPSCQMCPFCPAKGTSACPETRTW